MKKICFVIQRYGLEVNGGAELHCRQLAEHLTGRYDVTVLTTKAIDYITWRDEYENEDDDIHGVHIKRFSVDKERNMDIFGQEVTDYEKGERFQTESEQICWIENQGPYCPALIRYLKEQKDDYDCFIFFTYLYYTTVMGIREVAEKAIVIPTAHDEPFLNMVPYKNVFELPGAIFFNTEEERTLIENKFPNAQKNSDIGGVGVEVPEKADIKGFREKYQLDQYMIYIGRIDYGKNCHKLFEYFRRYKRRNKANLKLVLMGKAIMGVPVAEDIIDLGFVSDEDKFAGIAESQFLVLPSRFESLSMVVLEAFFMEIPVVVNGECQVLESHCRKGNAGLYYRGYAEFEGCVNYMLANPETRIMMGKNGARYVEENYHWDVIVSKLSNLIEGIATSMN